MAVAQLPVSALHLGPSPEDLRASCERYNKLDSDDRQPDVQEHLNHLGEIFLRWDVHKILGVHLIHGHFKLTRDHVMYGTSFERGISGWLTRSVHVDEIPANNVHGHIFALSADDKLLAYEYREGVPPQSLAGIPAGFFRDLISYLRDNRLESVLGLEILQHSPDSLPDILEYVIDDQATIMIEKNDIIAPRIYCYTGWTFDRAADGIVSCKGNVAHGSSDRGHIVYTDGKALREIDEFMTLLANEAIIRSPR